MERKKQFKLLCKGKRESLFIDDVYSFILRNINMIKIYGNFIYECVEGKIN